MDASKHGCQSITCSDSTFENSLRMIPNMDVNLLLVQPKDHENSLRTLPNMDVNLSLVQIQLTENSLQKLQTRKLIYCLFRPPTQRRSRPGYLSDTHSFTYNIQFDKYSWMASLSPSPTRFCHISKWHL